MNMVDDGLDDRLGRVGPDGTGDASTGTPSAGTTRTTARVDVDRAVEELSRKYLSSDAHATTQDGNVRDTAVRLGLLEQEVEAEASQELRERLSYLKDVNFHKYVGFPYNALLFVAKYAGSDRLQHATEEFVEKQIATRIPDLMAGELKKVEDYFRNESKRLDRAAKDLRSKRANDLRTIVVGNQVAESTYATLTKVEKEIDDLDSDLAKAVETGRDELVNAIEMKRIDKIEERERLMADYEHIGARVAVGYGRTAAEDKLIDRLKIKANKYGRYASQIGQQREQLVMYRDLQDVDMGQPIKAPREMEDMVKDVRSVVKHYQSRLDQSIDAAAKLPAALADADLMNPNPADKRYADGRRADIEIQRTALQGMRDTYLLKKAAGQK